jgi:CobQ/CobB/MinD/ParA nucleotide binding domain
VKKGADITIITGHFGSGKTEISINLALEARKTNARTAVADLDIVNPYYRARDARNIFEQNEIELIAPAERLAAADLPIVPGDMSRVIYDSAYKLIVDAGGDKDGATALGQFYNDWNEMKPEVLFILNANRPYVSTLEGAVETLQKIESASRLKITGIINNSNVGSETTLQDVEKGLILSKELSDTLGIPLLNTMVPQHLSAESPGIETESPVKVITRYLKLPWEM